MKNTSRALMVISVLLNAFLVFFHGQGIAVGGDCRTARLVALFTTGVIGVLIALMFLQLERQIRLRDQQLAELLRSVEKWEKA